jgi:ketosteroid isomerase-like protein
MTAVVAACCSGRLRGAISHENVERHRRALRAYNARDIKAMIAYTDPRVELHSLMAAVEEAVYHGHDGLLRWHQDLEDAWSETRFEDETFFNLGEHTLAFCVVHGRGRRSGAEVAMPVAHVARWRDGLMVYSKVYVQRGEALSDLGVSEDALEPIDP